MTREEIIRNLKYTMKKHKNDIIHTFDTNISVMCKDILDYLEQEPCNDITQERYKDLCEYFGDAKDILKSRDDFKAWLERVKWHIHKAEELFEKYEYKKEPYTDAVSREAVKEILTKYCLGESRIAEELNELPSVTQKSGKWIYNSHYGGYYECSVCGKGSGSKHKECPNCRAKMESEG